MFGFQILDLKDQFPASLKNFLHTAGGLLWMAYCIRLGLDSAICLDVFFWITDLSLYDIESVQTQMTTF